MLDDIEAALKEGGFPGVVVGVGARDEPAGTLRDEGDRLLGGAPGSTLPRTVTVIGPLLAAAGAALLTMSVVGGALALGMPPTLVPGVVLVVVMTSALAGRALVVQGALTRGTKTSNAPEDTHTRQHGHMPYAHTLLLSSSD